MQYFWVNRGFKPGDTVQFRNVLGQTVASLPVSMVNHQVATMHITGLLELPPGHYQLILQNKDEVKRLGAATWGGRR
jgi:hypothetical protein